MPDPRAPHAERARAIALAKIAARYNVVCGGIDPAVTLEALRARIVAARAEGNVPVADALEREIAGIGA